MEKESPQTTITLSELTPRSDFKQAESARNEVNKSIRAFCYSHKWKVISHPALNETGQSLNEIIYATNSDLSNISQWHLIKLHCPTVSEKEVQMLYWQNVKQNI